MNRVLNKDFIPGSYLNSALVSFSDVFRPASCMQCCNMREPERVNRLFFWLVRFSYAIPASHARESMRSGNAC
jgi:hypothetical protein